MCLGLATAVEDGRHRPGDPVAVSRCAGVGPPLEMANAFVTLCLASFGLLLPFMLLSFNHAFYRERLKHLLRLADETLPVASAGMVR